MTDHLAIVITAWATVVAAAAALVAVFVSHHQGRTTLEETRRATDATICHAKLATAYQLISQLDQQWDSLSMRTKRGKAAETLLRSLAEPKEDAPDKILDFFEILALSTNQGVLPFPLVWNFFSYWLIAYWFAAQPRINTVRSEDPTWWEELATFMPTLLDYHAQRSNKSVAEITPTPQEQQEFLKEELTAAA